MLGPIFTLIYDEARKVWCFRWLMITISATIFVVAAVIILALPNTYKASGQVMISEENTLTKAAEGVTLEGVNYADTDIVQKRMMTNEALQKVYLRAYPKATANEAAAAAASIAGRVNIGPDGDKFIQVSYSDSDPVRTQKITAALIDQFIVESLQRNVRELDQAGAFLDRQIVSYTDQLTTVRAEMAAFRQKHPRIAAAPVADNGGGGGAGDVASARAELAALTARAPRAAPVVAPQDAAIADAEGRLAGMLTQYTEQHPDVIAVRRQIAALKAQRAQFLATAPRPAATVDPAVAAARARLASAQARARPSAAGPAASDLSAQWAELSRRHDTLVQNHQELVTRREGAKTSRVLYGARDTGIYQITRQPTVPGGPSGPPRNIYLAAAAFIALGAGVAAAYLRAGITGIFVSPRELENAFQLPVIGTVSWEPAWHVSKAKRSTPALPAR